jgi:hypothetical protein
MIELLNENESIKGSFHFPYVHMRIIDIEYEDWMNVDDDDMCFSSENFIYIIIIVVTDFVV